MPGKTKIEWATDSWNPVTGCTKVSAGCANCYAEALDKRFGRDFSKVALHPERLDAPLRWKKPRRVFVNSVSDLFHDAIPDDFIAQVFSVMAQSERHTFQVLTKRPNRMARWFEWIETDGSSGERPAPAWPLPNVWLGVSVENQECADMRIPVLLKTPAAVRFVSAEPLLEEIYLDPWLRLAQPIIDWVIVGGESGPKARPMDLAWARGIVQQCRDAGVPCFVKQLGTRPMDITRVPYPRTDGGTAILAGLSGVQLRDRKGGDPSEWPEDLRVREYPSPEPEGRRGASARGCEPDA